MGERYLDETDAGLCFRDMNRMFFVPCGSEVISDEVDGAVVAINLLTGRYFNMSASASRVWGRLHEGGQLTLPAEADSRVLSFFDTLVDEGLCQRVNGTPLSSHELVVEDLDFKDLSVTGHADLQELLALDPIHDVDPTAGWPHQP